MRRTFDVVVVGSGSAGTAAATALRKAGRTVALVDERAFGGTCALRGCDPKKVLVAAARAVDAAMRYRALGIFSSVPDLDWDALMRFKRTFTDPVPAGRERTYREAGIESFHGTARFIGASALRVGDDEFAAERIVLATGARPSSVCEGDDILLTSEDFLELPALPRSLVILGGGYIAFEFAHVAARAGSRVTILEHGELPLSGFDPDAVRMLLEHTRRIGVAVELRTGARAVERTDDGIAIHAETPGGPRTFRAENGLLAAGRAPNLDALDLAAAGVARTKKGVAVDAHLRSTTNPAVYACGDCADGGGRPLTPVAAYEGEIVARNMLHGDREETDFSGLASMVYTIPPLGTVGSSEEQARGAGIALEVKSGGMESWFSTRHEASSQGFFKTIARKDGGALLGATIYGPHAEEQINVLALAVRRRMPLDELRAAFYAYPTGASDIEYLL